MFSEEELLALIIRLVDVLAKLQKCNISHRNIKPANLVFASNPRMKKQKQLNFDDLIVCNFEMATSFPVDA